MPLEVAPALVAPGSYHDSAKQSPKPLGHLLFDGFFFWRYII